MNSPNWFQRKWGLDDPLLVDEMYKRILELEKEIIVLKEENIETTNVLYELANSINALDSRIDILFENRKNTDV